MAYHHRPCDSYFVESHKPRHGNPATQAYLEKIGRRKQEEMSNILSLQACDDYILDITKHMIQMEDDTLPDVASIDIQEEIQWFMRTYLVDFLIEAHSAFQLLPETLFLTINLLDRYCSRRVVYKRHYQLVGCAALLIAAKYGDKKEKVPMIPELKSMCCGLYDEEMFTQMEWHVLNTLDWVIGHPTIDSWIQIALIEGQQEYEDLEIEHLAWYICEMAIYHKEFVSTRASHMAYASLALARRVLGRSDQQDDYDNSYDSTYCGLYKMLNRPSTVLARKYSSPQFSRVATTLEKFFVQQAAIQRYSQAPSSYPELQTEQISKITPHSDILCTPQKSHCGNVANGYLTPPITPEGEYFITGEEGRIYSSRCPVTPSPQQYYRNPYIHYPRPQQYHPNAYLCPPELAMH